MSWKPAARLAAIAVAACFVTGCPDDIPPSCRTTCEACCQQEADCLGADSDECFSSCYSGCQRAYAVYRNSECWTSRLASRGCVCALTCDELAELEAGTADHCSAEIDQEEQDCEWF